MPLEKCARCGGNMYLDPLDYEADRGRTGVGVDDFVGFEHKCLMCSRTSRDISVQELILALGYAPARVERMRWSSFNPTSIRGGPIPAVLNQVRALLDEAA